MLKREGLGSCGVLFSSGVSWRERRSNKAAFCIKCWAHAQRSLTERSHNGFMEFDFIRKNEIYFGILFITSRILLVYTCHPPSIHI